MGQETTKDFSNRLDLVRSKLADWEVDAILITNNNNRRWLSGFSGSAGLLLVSEDKAWLGTDSRYWEQAEEQAPGFELFRFKGRPDVVMLDFVKLAGEVRIGFEADHVTVSRYDKLNSLDGVTWISIENILSQFRQRKDEGEIITIQAAAKITDVAMAMVNSLAHPGITERDLAWKLEMAMREAGATGLAFPVIVASGSNSARPHHEPGDRPLTMGDSIIIDMGAEVDGYCSDMTRSFFLGDESDEQFDRIYNIVLEAEQNAIQKMRGGMTGKEIDSFAREIISDAGFGDEFGHSLGHGLGLEVHEQPNLSPLAEDMIIVAGAVVTVEPGIYIPGWGGVRIEDLVQVTKNGVNMLSACPKTPVISG
ncbi:MAG TPA: aminopeptidase P family protein [Patescibacteria group bacterium]|nr:aminopeptidase P family protein [Patescibacteria group bacterium]